MARRQEIVSWLDQLLEADRVRDVAFNGLQVQGRDEVHRIVTGVSANLALLEAARDRRADLVLVHHGLVWGGIQSITGTLRGRLALLLGQDMSLVAHHLPLDKHPEHGNNAGLARVLGLQKLEPFGSYKGQLISLQGELPKARTLDEIVKIVRERIHPEPRVLSGGNHVIRRVALCSGGAPDLAEEAIAAGADLFLSGEAGEYSPALAIEGGLHTIAAGHHATERFGVRRLADLLAGEFDCEVEFVDVPNDL